VKSGGVAAIPAAFPPLSPWTAAWVWRRGRSCCRAGRLPCGRASGPRGLRSRRSPGSALRAARGSGAPRVLFPPQAAARRGARRFAWVYWGRADSRAESSCVSWRPTVAAGVVCASSRAPRGQDPAAGSNDGGEGSALVATGHLSPPTVPSNAGPGGTRRATSAVLPGLIVSDIGPEQIR